MASKWRRKVRVLAADDSAVMRGIFRALFEPLGAPEAGHAPSDLPEMELCGVARDGLECLSAVERLRPDVLLLDLEMPRMHGLDVLARLRVQAPMLPTIMCSAYTERGARATLDGLARGAADYVTKPAMQADAAAGMETLRADLLPKIAALAGWSFMGTSVSTAWAAAPVRSVPAPLVAGTKLGAIYPAKTSGESGRVEAIAIGVSTGGPSALEKVLPRLPKDFPVPLLIVQHMPKLFTAALAERLDGRCALRVREGYHGASVEPGTIWFAPGGSQMEVATSANGSGTVLRLSPGDPESNYRPAVDTLFSSFAKRYGPGGVGLVMTGMGSDGLAGSLAIRSAGGAVLVQDEATSAIWGMPGRVAETGMAAATLPLEEIAAELMRRAARGSHGTAIEDRLLAMSRAGDKPKGGGKDGLFGPGL